MIQTSAEFQSAIVGSPRWVELSALVDFSDPDKEYLPVTSSPEAAWSRKEQLHNLILDSPPRYATLEGNRWLLGGDFDLFEDGYDTGDEETGYASEILSDSAGAFPGAFAQLNFSNVRILQACSVVFDSDPINGIPVDFKVEILSAGAVVHKQEFTGNRDTQMQVKGFTVHTPDAIRVTVTKWSLPYRRMRMAEIIMGYFEVWNPDIFSTFSANLQGQFSCLSLPYGSVNLSMDNADRRFEPRKKDSLFQSIEERQGVDIYLGCQTSSGVERVKLGVFYQAGDGWKTSSNAPTMSWYLVDIIGLIADRTFIVPDTLPTTLGGWLKALVSQLGDNFVNRWRADPNYIDTPVLANSREDVSGKKCGEILRWACQASGTWPRARQADGALTAEPLWNQGIKITLNELVDYPAMKANESIAALIFQLALPPLPDGTEDKRNREFVVSGNSTTSEKTVSISNPFLHTQEQALAAARLILAQYGGNILELSGRGNPSSEIGDVDTVWLDESYATTARRMSQTLQFQEGVLQQCQSTHLQADGSYLWTEFVIIRESGKWKAPPGVRRLRIVLGRGGQGGGLGQDGQWERAGDSAISFSGYVPVYGADGLDGKGGEIWYGVIDINEGQVFDVFLGEGGKPGTVYGQPGEMGEHTRFGAYSSENGRLYENGYTDIANGQVFARTGVEAPLPGTGDGGNGGRGGDPGEGYLEEETKENPDGTERTVYHWVTTKEPGPGFPGVKGATGFVMVTWDKP